MIVQLSNRSSRRCAPNSRPGFEDLKTPDAVDAAVSSRGRR
jgi:hypothetical protein